MIYKMDLKDSVDTMTFNLLETPIVDKDIEGAVDNVTLDGNQYTDYLYLKKQYIQKWAIMCPDEYDELRGFYTRQFEEGEVPSYRVYYGANVTRDYTFNGDYFQFNAEGIETGMTLSQLLGNAEQTTYSGKNLLPPPDDFTQTVSGVTVKCENGVYTFSGTATANGSTTARATVAQYTIQAGDYFHYCNSLASPNINIQLIFTDNTSLATSMNVTNRVLPIDNYNGTSYVGKTISSCRVNFVSGFAFNGTASPMILHNVSTVADYEPYVGGIPAPNPQFPMPISTVTSEQTVKITGKNLFDKDNANILNAYIDASHASITSNSNNRIIWIPCQPNTTYTLQKLAVGTSWYARQIAYTTQEPAVGVQTYSMADMAGNDTSKTYTTGADAKYLVVRIWVSGQDAETFDAMLGSIQLELGSTATAYEPYQGQEFPIDLGKNLFDVSQSLEYKWLSSVDGSLVGSLDKNIVSDYIRVKIGQPYTISGIGSLQFNVWSYDTSSSATGKTHLLHNSTAVRTITPDTNYIRFSVGGGDATAIKNDIQFEAGTQATPYAPYKTPLELAKIGDYQDRIYKTDGKWYIEKQVEKVVFDGSESGWGNIYVNTQGLGTCQLQLEAPVVQGNNLGICDHFTYKWFYNSATECFYVFNSSDIGRIIFITKFTVRQDWLDWLASNPTTVYYALATPTTTEITDETLLAQLNFLASLYKGENNISLVGTGAQGEMEVFIRDVMSVETDVVPEVPVRLTLTDDGVINACGCRRNVQLTMRETTE